MHVLIKQTERSTTTFTFTPITSEGGQPLVKIEKVGKPAQVISPERARVVWRNMLKAGFQKQPAG